MTAINVTSVNVLDNPSKVTNPLQFEIQYDCLYDLADGAWLMSTRERDVYVCILISIMTVVQIWSGS